MLERRSYADMVSGIFAAGFLRDMRHRHPQWTLGEMARATGLGVVRLCEIERRRGEPPTEVELEAIGRVLWEGLGE